MSIQRWVVAAGVARTGSNFWGRSSRLCNKRLTQNEQICIFNTCGGGACFSHAPIPLAGTQHPQIILTSYKRAHSTRNSSQIVHGGHTRRDVVRRIFTGSTVPPAWLKFLVIANVLVKKTVVTFAVLNCGSSSLLKNVL